MKKNRDPLGPLEFIVTAIGVLIIAAVVGGAVMAVVGNGSVFGYGDRYVCVTSSTTGLGMGNVDRRHGVAFPKAGVSQSIDRVTLCDGSPSPGQRLLQAGTMLPSFLYLLGFLVLVRSMIGRARHEGLFTTLIARRLTALGVYVLVGAVLSGAANGLCTILLGRTMVTEGGPGDYNMLGPSWIAIIAGFGLLTLGRVMRHGVVLQQEIDTLV